MAINYIPLDKDKHSALKVLPKVSFEYAKDTHLAAATIREFAQLATTMPIFFIEDPNTKNTHTVAMLGIEQSKNLFWADDKWQGPHVPLNIQRYPFDIRPDGDKLGVFIDENSDMIGEQGETLFTKEGEASEFLKNRQQFLAELANSEMLNQRFIAKIVELELLEEVQIGIQYESGQSRNITGINAVSEKKLHALSDEVILDLHKQGFLGAIYAMLLSLGQLNRLVELSVKTDMPVRSLQLRPAQVQQNAQPA
ncbi:SapC family protein [Glaciecola sp. KUL10]|uniref:SapC family protein n=1 Tax=Glaciecola sp. (strain KUL10) TaxID=2161813 RepID=UPI000D788703|nr:SapC family protein [Glaciecola sp. KUL10]GBL05612.1 SapC protein [Glaciecola sp. KUL10]